MSLIVNLRHLDARNLHLKGTLPVQELDLRLRDEMIRAEKPLAYDLNVEKLSDGILVSGQLKLPLTCECVRCLKSFRSDVFLEDWKCHLPLAGEEAVSVDNDCVDLTPFLREDILLEFPQHPLCQPDCQGLKQAKAASFSESGTDEPESSAWAELDKLKLN